MCKQGKPKARYNNKLAKFFVCNMDDRCVANMKVIDELIAYLDREKLLSEEDIQALEALGYYVNDFDAWEYVQGWKRSSQEIEWEKNYWAEPERPEEPQSRARPKLQNRVTKTSSAKAFKKTDLAAHLKALRSEKGNSLDGFQNLAPQSSDSIDKVISQLLTLSSDALKKALKAALKRNAASFTQITLALSASYHQRISPVHSGPSVMAYRALQLDLEAHISSKYGWILSEFEINLAINIQRLQLRLAAILREFARIELDVFHQKLTPFSTQTHWFLTLLISLNNQIDTPRLVPTRSHILPNLETLFWLLRLASGTAKFEGLDLTDQPHGPLLLLAIRNLRGENLRDMPVLPALYCLDIWDAEYRPPYVFLPPKF